MINLWKTKKRLDIRRFNILTKIVLSFLLMMVPVYVTSLYMNQSAEKNMQIELSQSVVSKVHFYLSSLETEMSRIIRLNKQYIFEDDFQKIRTIANEMDDFTRTQTILSVKNKLEILKTSSPYVENVKVYIPSLGRGIFANNFDNHIDEDELTALNHSANLDGYPFTYWNNHLFLSEMYPEHTHEMRFSILLAVVLSQEQLKRSLVQINTLDNSGAALINVRNKWVVSDGKSDSIQSKLIGLITQPRFQNSVVGQGSLIIEGTSYLVTFEYSKLLDTYLTVYIPEGQILEPLSKFRSLFWLFSIISTFVILIFSYWIYRLIHQPLRRLVKAFREVEMGNLHVTVQHNNRDEFFYLYEQFNDMVRKLNILIQEVYEERIHSQHSELKQLQSQINPHFLYNSFFILQGLVRMNDTHSAERLIQHLGSYFQFITRSGLDDVSLENEVSHAYAYTEIQMVRFANQIQVEWDLLPEECKLMVVPRLILQPIIENAYQHGLEDKIKDGKLSVQFVKEKAYFLITVEDNGENMNTEDLLELQRQLQAVHQAKEATGMLNVHRRLQLKYGERYGLSISRGLMGGLRVDIKLPYREDNEHV